MNSRRPRGRARGEKKGSTKRKILFYIYDHEDGVGTDDIYDFCGRKLNIKEHTGILNNHLYPLEEKRYILSERGSDNGLLWKPNVDEGIIQEIWKDYRMIWGGIPSISDICAFTSTSAMRSFIRQSVLPEFKESPVSRLEHWKSMYSGLPSRRQLDHGGASNDSLWVELDNLICWAHQVNPCLISHHFDRQRDLILFTTFTLADFFEHHDVSRIWEEKGMRGITYDLRSLTRTNPLLSSTRGYGRRVVSQEFVMLATIYLSFIANKARFGREYDILLSEEEFRRIEKLLDSSLRTLGSDVGKDFAASIQNISVVIGTLQSFRDSDEKAQDPRIFLMNM